MYKIPFQNKIKHSQTIQLYTDFIKLTLLKHNPTFTEPWYHKVNNCMSLKITPQIFKWLQSLSLIKQAKRNNEFLQLPEEVSLKFFDGNHIALIIKNHFTHVFDDELLRKLEGLKENSNPAIRLYNWNILGDVLKRVKGANLDSAQKSKLLSFQSQPILKILKALYESRQKSSQPQKKGLKIQITQIHKKTLLQASNAMQFLLLSLSKNFKLSPQHTLNLFLDNNKYLSHLLVKGVKNNFNPIYDFLNEIKNNLDYLVSHVFCIDEEENVSFFFNALKSCLISKDDGTVWACLELMEQIHITYKLKGLSAKCLKNWVKTQGVNTLFFVVTKSPQYFQKIIQLTFMYLDTDILQFFKQSQKSLLWNNDRQKLSVFRKLITSQNPEMTKKLIESTYFQDWLKYFIKQNKKLKQPQQMYDMNIIFETLWLLMQDKFQDEKFNLVNSYSQFLKTMFGMKHSVCFFSAAMSMFNLIKQLGLKKNNYAPFFYKTAVNVFANLTPIDEEKITFFCQNFIFSIKEIKNLPGGSLVSPIIKHLTTYVNPSLLELCKILFEEKRVNQQQSIELLEILTKIIFQDSIFSELAIQIVFEYIPSLSDQIADEYLSSNSKLSFSNFVSQAKGVSKTIKQLKSQIEEENKNYKEDENTKVKEGLLNHLKRFLLIRNCIQFLTKYLQIEDINLKNSLEAVLFHTYAKAKVDLKKPKVANFLMPLMKRYYQNDQDLQNTIQDYQKQNATEIQQGKQYTSKITLLKSIKLNKSLDMSAIQNTSFKTLNPSTLKPSQFAIKDLQSLKQKREHFKTIELQKQNQSVVSQLRMKQIKNFMNQKRIIEYGANGKVDFDYKGLYQFDSMKQEEVVSGVPMIRLVNFQKEQQQTYEDDLRNVVKKYRKVWRFLFFKYSTFGAKKQEFKTQEKINIAEIWKMIREYQVFAWLKKQESQTIVKVINDNMKRKNDPQCLTYPGFEQYISQVCCYAYSKSIYPHIPPGRQVLLFIQQLKKSTKQKGGSIDLFQNPEDIYFQQTDVIRQYNRRLKENPDYILPEGYKKYKQFSLEYDYSMHPMLQKNIKSSIVDVYQVLHEILYQRMGICLIEPISVKGEVTLAKPVLFQNIAEKMKEYKRGYLQPKSTIQINQKEDNTKSKQLRKSVVIKKQFRPHINFSLGIKLGLSSVSVKNKTVAQEVAYWMHDMLNAIQNQSLKIQNSAKKKTQNFIVKKRRVQSLQRLKKEKSQKKQWKKRAESVKVRLQMQKKLKDQQNTKKKQIQIEQKRKKRAREEDALKRKLTRFQEMKKVMSQKKQEAKYKKIQEEDKRKERLETYKEKVAEYFEKKRQEILQNQQQLKKQKEEKQKEEQQKKTKQQQFIKQLYLANLKKQQGILQKADQLKQQYEELWESEDIQNQLAKYERELQYLFNLLLKYEKSKISATSFDQIGLNTLHYFALKFMLIPFMVEKTQLIKIFNFVIKEKEKRAAKEEDEKSQKLQEIQLTFNKPKSPGLNFKNFQETLFLISVKAKKLLNKIKQKRKKRLQKLMEFLKEKKAEDGNHFDVEDMSDSEGDQDQQEQEQQEKAPGLLEQYLFKVDDVDEETLQQVFVFLKLPKDKLGVEERYRQAIQSKNLKPKNILKEQLKKQMETVKIQDIKEEQQDQQEDEDEE